MDDVLPRLLELVAAVRAAAPECWAVMNPSTSAGETSAGGFAPTVKNVILGRWAESWRLSDLAAGLHLQPFRWESRFMDERVSGPVLELKVVVDTPRERVFTLLTEPAELARWWGPHGFTLPEIELALTRGGGYRFTMQPPEGEPFHISGEFLEIQRPSRLVYTFRYEEPAPDDRETVVALSLDPMAGATEVSLTQGEFATEERLELHRTGWTESFEKMRELVGPGPGPGPGPGS